MRMLLMQPRPPHRHRIRHRCRSRPSRRIRHRIRIRIRNRLTHRSRIYLGTRIRHRTRFRARFRLRNLGADTGLGLWATFCLQHFYSRFLFSSSTARRD